MSRNLPDVPQNGTPWLSSACPGASPMIRMYGSLVGGGTSGGVWDVDRGGDGVKWVSRRGGNGPGVSRIR